MGVLSVIKEYGTEILNAVRNNDVKTLKNICDKQLKHDKLIAQLCTMDIKHRPSRKFACPLIIAARLEDPSIIKYMMEVGTNPNFIHYSIQSTGQKDVVTPLHVAVDLNLIRTVDVLLSFSADPNITDHNEETPFIISIRHSNWMLMNMMLLKGGSISITDKKGNAPLHIATLHGHLQIVKTLLKNNADIHQRGFQGAIPSHIAAREGHIHLIQIFCSADPALVNTKISCFTDQREKAMLHLAAERGHAETVIALIDQFGADVNLKDSGGNTPLHCVVLHYYQHHKMRDKDYFYATAKILIKCKTLIDERNNFGQTALHLAAMNNHPKIVELLLSVGSNAFAEDNDRMKPIDVVPDEETISKQLLKTAMLNPKPPLNVSSLTLTNNSSFYIHGAGEANKNRFINKLMLESIGSSPKIKSRNMSLDSSVFASNIKSSQSPATHRHRKPSREKTKEKIHDYSKQHRKHLHKRDTRSQSSENNLASLYSSRSYGLNLHDSRYHGDSSSESSDSDTLRERRIRHHRRRDGSHYNEKIIRNDRKSKRIQGESDDSSSYAFMRNDGRIVDHRHRIKESKRKTSKSRKASRGYVSENHSIEVHRIPGKPKTIEVEYMNGPITIEFENQDQNVQDERKVPKERSRKSRPEVKRHDANTKTNDWFNEMMKYNTNKKKLNEDAWDEYEENQIITKKAGINMLADEESPGAEFNQVGRVKKGKPKNNKQMQFEEQIEMEKLPIADPEPPLEKLEQINDEHFSDDSSSSFNSESFEEEINDTQKVLNDSASRKIIDVLQRIKSKWSQDEYSDEEPNSPKKQTKNNWNHQYKLQQLPRNVANFNDNPKNQMVPGNDASGMYQSSFKETINNEVVKVEIIPTNNKNVDVKNKNNIDANSSATDNKSQKSLFKISGETPKAYTRKGKASARARFILAAPARIESSSEASDNEQPASSMQRRAEWSKPLSPVHQNATLRSASQNIHSSFKTEFSDFSPSIKPLNPYKSFGKIVTKTDSLEDISRTTEGKSLDTSSEESGGFASPTLSTIIPERYQIKISSSDDGVKNINDLKEAAKVKPSECVEYKSPEVKSPEMHLKNYAKEPNSKKTKSKTKHHSEDKNEKRMKVKIRNRGNVFPERKPTKAPEEVLDNLRLLPFNEYTFNINSEKTCHKQVDEKSFEQEDHVASNSQLDISVPLVSADSSSLNSLNADVPLLSDNENSEKCELSHKKINNEGQFRLKKTSHEKKRSSHTKVERNKEKQPEPFPREKLIKPPKPLNSHQGVSRDDKMKKNNQNNVEDLNVLPYPKNEKKAIPKYPSRPYDVRRMVSSSDSEMNTSRSSRRKHFYYIHSEAEASDFELPKDPLPGTTYKEAVLKSLNSKIRSRSLLLRQPGHHDKSFEYLRKFYLPKRRKPRIRSQHLVSSAGKYGDRELRRVMSNQYFTESESEIDQNRSFITDDEFDDRPGSSQSLTSKQQDKKISPIYESLMKYKKFKMKLESKKEENASDELLKPRFGFIETYDDIARMWIEQVDKDTVLKCNNMYLKVLYQNRNLSTSSNNIDTSYSSLETLPHWVVARTRFIQTKMNDLSMSKILHEEDLSLHRHLILFFKIGMNWMELAWVFFDGLLTESEIVRMIKDIQIKHPYSLSEQVEDLMRRWWHKKGDLATIQELQRALDLLQMFYIQKEIDGSHEDIGTLVKYVETEDDLDIEKISDDDKNISSLCQEYDHASMNNSIACQSWSSSRHSERLTSDQVMRKLQTAKTVQNGMNDDLMKVSRPSSRSQEFSRNNSKNYKNLFSSDKKRKQPKLETNL